MSGTKEDSQNFLEYVLSKVSKIIWEFILRFPNKVFEIILLKKCSVNTHVFLNLCYKKVK
jgi:hypothetical protein